MPIGKRLIINRLLDLFDSEIFTASGEVTETLRESREKCRRGELRFYHFGFVTYLLTFSCYRTHMRGDERGSWDRRRGAIERSDALVDYGKRMMTYAEAGLEFPKSLIVLGAIREVCLFRGWTLFAAHVRSTHVHVVVGGVAEASYAIRDFKAHSSRALNEGGARRRWARGGNARMLRDARAVRAAVRYVVEGQGPMMAV